MKDKVYLNLSKLSKEVIKEIGEIIIETEDLILEETLKDLSNGVFTEGYKFLFYSPSGWNQNDYNFNNRKEINIISFRRLLKDEIKNKKDYQKKTILNKIKYKIKLKNINKTDLAKQLNIGRATLWRYLENKKDIPLETFLHICDILEISIITN